MCLESGASAHGDGDLGLSRQLIAHVGLVGIGDDELIRADVGDVAVSAHGLAGAHLPVESGAVDAQQQAPFPGKFRAAGHHDTTCLLGGFDQVESRHKKFGASLKAGGILIANTSRVLSEITREDITVVSVPADDIAVELGSIKCANIILIGALIGAEAGIITEEAMLASLEAKFGSKKKEILELNKVALQKGIEYGKKALA